MEEVAGCINLGLEKTKNLNTTLDNIKLKNYQEFIAKVFLGLENLNRLFLIWDTGAGKTLVNIFIIKNLTFIYPKWHIFILVKASLHHDPWLQNIYKYSEEYVNKITILHYDDPNMFISLTKKIKEIDLKTTRLLIIIDECHNFISRNLPLINNKKKRKSSNVYNLIKKLLNIKNNRLILISATPIINTIYEFQLIYGLLKNSEFYIKENLFINNNLIYKQELINNLAGSFSYYKFNECDTLENMERSEYYPKKNINYIECIMTEYQSNIYFESEILDKQTEKTSGFRIKRRLASTFVYEGIKNKLLNETITEYEERIKNKLFEFILEFKNFKFSKEFKSYFITDSLNDYFNDDNSYKKIEEIKYNKLKKSSCKYIETCKIILNSNGKCLIYETFVSFEGVASLKYYLDCFDISYIEYTNNSIKDRLINIKNFNDINNIYGDKIKTCIFSNAGSEGISFTCINELLILDIPWSDANLRQIIGRGIRLNSHINLPINNQYININILISKTNPNLKKKQSSIDEELLSILKKKNIEIKEIYNIFKNSSLENIHKLYPNNITDNDYYLNILFNESIELKDNIDILEKKYLTPVKYSSDNYLSIFNGYLDKTNNYLYNNINKIGYIKNDEFKIINNCIVYLMFNF